MPVFPSKEWCEALIRALEADPLSAKAGQGWQGDVAGVVLPDAGFPEPFAVHAVPKGGRVTGFRVLEDLDEVEELEPTYVARAPYAVWKSLIAGELDPVEAVVKRRIQLTGDLEQVIARAQYKDVLRRALAAVPTTFADGA